MDIRQTFKTSPKFLLWILIAETGFAVSTIFLPWYIPFLAIILGLVLLLLLKRPEYSLIPLAYFYIFENIRISLKTEHRILEYAVPIDLLIIFPITAIILGKCTKKLRPLEPSPVYLPLIAFTGFAFMSNIWAPDHYYGMLFSLKLLSCVLLFYCAVQLTNNRRTIEMLCWFFLAAGITASVIGYLSSLKINLPLDQMLPLGFLDVLGYPEKGSTYLNKEKTVPLGFMDLGFSYIYIMKSTHTTRASGIAHPNTASFFLNISTFFGLIILFSAKSKLKKFMIGCILIFILMGNVLTSSKGGLLSLIIVATFYVSVLPKLAGKRVAVWMAWLTMLISALIFVIMVVNRGDPGKLGKDPTETRGKSSLGSRLELWETGFDKLVDSYGLGLGIGGIVNPLSYRVNKASNWQGAYWSVLFDFGLIGSLLFVWLALMYLKEILEGIRKCMDEYLKTALISIGCIMMIYSLHTWIEMEVYFRAPWFIAGLLFGAVQSIRRQAISASVSKEEI